jgi:hypothetical protein
MNPQDVVSKDSGLFEDFWQLSLIQEAPKARISSKQSHFSKQTNASQATVYTSRETDERYFKHQQV